MKIINLRKVRQCLEVDRLLKDKLGDRPPYTWEFIIIVDKMDPQKKTIFFFQQMS